MAACETREIALATGERVSLRIHDNIDAPDDMFWSAITDSYEPGHPIGRGASRQEAIEDLKFELEENDRFR